jgi:hypothetical protein
MWRVAVNIFNKQPQKKDKGWSPCLGVGHRGNSLTVKCSLLTKQFTDPRTWTDSLDKWPKQQNMDMRFGRWDVVSTYMATSIIRASRELSRYKLFLMVMEVKWEGSIMEPAEHGNGCKI